VRSLVPLLALLLAVAAGGIIVGISQFRDPGQSGVGPSAGSWPTTTPRPTALRTPTPTITPSPTPSPVPPREIATTWTYTTLAGDSLSLIATRYLTTTEQLVQLNPQYGEDRDEVIVGDEVIVPCTPIAVAEGRCG